MSVGTTPTVWVHPGRYHGEPCIEGHRIPTRMVAEHVLDGTGDTAEDTWDISRDQVMVACWFEARYGSRRLKRAWAAWLAEWEPVLWHAGTEDWAKVPFPPARVLAEVTA